jgi:hypothetical protein
MEWVRRSWQDGLDSEELIGWVGFREVGRMGWIRRIL